MRIRGQGGEPGGRARENMERIVAGIDELWGVGGWIWTAVLGSLWTDGRDGKSGCGDVELQGRGGTMAGVQGRREVVTLVESAQHGMRQGTTREIKGEVESKGLARGKHGFVLTTLGYYTWRSTGTGIS